MADRLACVTGRFQPVHRQHMQLFQMALRGHDHLIVAVTNPDQQARHAEPTSTHRHTAAANPFGYYQRARLLDAALTAAGLLERATLVPFDLTRPDIWPEYVPLHADQLVRVYSDWERDKATRLSAAGYRVTVLDGDPVTKLAASEVRRRFAGGDASWAELVPEATVPLLREFLGAR
jgi:nicotinamide mononucleotide adenylyltransferase